MTNKELAVQVWTAMLQATATIGSSEKFNCDVIIPSPETAVNEISVLANLLSQIDDR